MARNSKELAKGPAVSPEDEPSAEWGWHGSFPRGSVVAGVVSAIALLLMIFGPYQSKTHELWLIGIAALILLGIVLQAVRKRNSWRR